MAEDVPGLADVLVNFGKGALDFLVRVTGIGEGVQLLLGFAEQQIEKISSHIPISNIRQKEANVLEISDLSF